MKRALIILTFILSAVICRGQALDTVNVGAYNNDPNADKLRTSFIKTNKAIKEINRVQLYNLNSNELAILDGALVTTTELNRLVGVTSSVQTQLNARVRTVDSTGNAAGNYVTRRALRDSIEARVELDSVRNLTGEAAFYDTGSAIPPHIPDEYTDNPYEIFPEIHAFPGDTANFPVPSKVGDIFINTSASKVYVSVKNTRGGWVILNLVLPLFVMIIRRRRK